jgi:hypothetical protein
MSHEVVSEKPHDPVVYARKLLKQHRINRSAVSIRKALTSIPRRSDSTPPFNCHTLVPMTVNHHIRATQFS